MADESAPQANVGRAVLGTGKAATRSAEVASRSGETVPRGELRASHEDRDRVVELLRVSAGDGRLTAEELDERVEAALTARTYNELAALVADLPSAPGAAVSASASKPREVVRIDCTHGNTNRQGHWTVPQRLEVRIKHGNVRLDFTDAEITSPTLQIDTDIHHGNLTLLTRPGIVVSTDDLAIHGGNVKVGPMPSAGTPIMLRIDVSGRVHHSNIRVRRPGSPRGPRRTFWQWLTRQPRPVALRRL
jgi:hypothetical protein